MQHALASKFLGPIFTAAALILFSFTPSVSAKDAAKDAGKGIAKPTGRIAVKSGDKIAFLGDSITAAGWENPAGYVRLVMAGLAANGIIAEAVPAGVNGHKSDQMLARLETDVLGMKPQWMTLSCGLNDVLLGAGGVPLDEAAAARPGEYDAAVAQRGTFKKNVTQIVEQATAAGVKPVLLTSTVIREDLDDPRNDRLVPYNDFLRSLAKKKQLPLADLNPLFQNRIRKENTRDINVLTTDGIHMNAEGNKLMATGVLQAFGLDAGQIEKAKAAWAEPRTPGQ